MKKNLIITVALAAALSLTMFGCKNSSDKQNAHTHGSSCPTEHGHEHAAPAEQESFKTEADGITADESTVKKCDGHSHNEHNHKH
ncbi:MAG: hypothetical protein LBI42_00490 [Chitinispirillales bacterium]|jgi:uncharacterized lipoprotein NlpE involved in copper resistance|nr:hypothetical protein [Chitinispirillales bacterium]